MDKNMLKAVIADNQLEVPRYNVVPRDFTFEEFGNYVFVGIRRAGKSYLLYQRMQQLLARGVEWDEIQKVKSKYYASSTTISISGDFLKGQRFLLNGIT